MKKLFTQFRMCLGMIGLFCLSLFQLSAVPFSEFFSENTPMKTIVYKTVPIEPVVPGATPNTTERTAATTGELTMALFNPPDWKPSDKRSVVVMIHGGAWRFGDGKGFLIHARYFASRGAVGISLEYRLVTPTTVSVGDSLADCKSAIRYLRAHAAELGIDPDRIVVMGDSAGGHLAAALGTCEGFDDPTDDLKISSVPNAMILCNPIVDMTDGSWINFIIRGEAFAKKPAPEAVIPSQEQLKLGKALSPLFQVKAGQPPALLMHGLDDHVVNPDQARSFAAAALAVKNRCDLVLLEGCRHAFVVPKYTAPESVVVDAIRRSDEFLISLGLLSGTPTLEVSNPPAWEIKKK